MCSVCVHAVPSSPAQAVPRSPPCRLTLKKFSLPQSLPQPPLSPVFESPAASDGDDCDDASSAAALPRAPGLATAARLERAEHDPATEPLANLPRQLFVKP